ncbi:MAG: outer membrane lipoprotein-sorting protein [Planctomycetota bacterium]
MNPILRALTAAVLAAAMFSAGSAAGEVPAGGPGQEAGEGGGGAPSPEALPKLEEILEVLDDMYRSEASKARVRMTIVKRGRERTMTMRSWSKGTERALMVIDGPAKYAGHATLKVEKNLWNYLPKIKRTIRIPPSMMLASWMGSDFTNDDIVREASFREDFESRVVGRTKEPDGWEIEMVAKEGAVGLWKRIRFVVSPDGKLPLRSSYYDRRGRLARVMVFDKVRQFGTRRVPARMVLTPMDEGGKPRRDQRTELEYLDIEFDADVPENTFSLSRLERQR